MADSKHRILVKAEDQTAGGFRAIQGRAAAASSKLRSMLGGALAGAAAYLSARSVISAVNELGKLSDVAMATGTNVDELTRTVGALGVLGVQGMSVESLAKAFQMMEKNTGKSGLQGFYDVIGEIGKLESASDRAGAAMQVFGRSGLAFMPLINAADQGTEALQGCIDVMPGVPQAAADAGDDAADAMGIMASNVKSIWMEGIGTIVGWFGKNYEGGIRGAALSASNSMILYAKVAVQTAMRYYRSFENFFEKVGGWVGTFVGALSEGGSIGEAFKMANEDWQTTAMGQEIIEEKIRAEEDKRIARWTDEFTNRQAKIEKFAKNYQRAARSSRDRAAIGDGDIGAIGGKAQVRNDLIMAGSNAANRLAMMGPTTQELKKQTELLQSLKQSADKIEDNTRAAGEADNAGVFEP